VSSTCFSPAVAVSEAGAAGTPLAGKAPGFDAATKVGSLVVETFTPLKEPDGGLTTPGIVSVTVSSAATAIGIPIYSVPS
jgi:hypothetical protein